MKSTVVRLAIVFCLIAFAVSASAYTWNAVGDFSGTRNPNGLWSYGCSNAGIFTPYQYTQSWDGYLGTGLALNWGRSTDPNYPGGYPVVLKNISGSQIRVWEVVIIPIDRLFMTSMLDLPNIVRFTVPATGLYTVNASYEQCDVASQAGLAVYSGWYTISWTGASDGLAEGAVITMPTAANVSLDAGDTISFEVNVGNNGVAHDSVALAATVELNLAGQGLVSGVVKNDATTPWPGKVIPNASVEVVGGPSMTTADDGVYYFKLTPGTYTLRASKDGYTTKDTSVTVSADGEVLQDIEMALADASITGVVKNGPGTTAPGQVIPGVTVETTNGAASAVTDGQGRYALVVPAGTYTLRASKFGYETKEVALGSVAGGASIAQEIELNFDFTMWDAVRDFSVISNPSGLWSYGYTYTESGVFNLFQFKNSWDAYYGPGKGINWGRSASPDYPIGYPVVLKNISGANLRMWDVVLIPTERLFMTAMMDMGNIVKWTAPVTGTYTVDGSFMNCDANSSAGLMIYTASKSIDWSAESTVLGEGGVLTMPTATTVSLAAGDSVFFEVNQGSNGSIADDCVAMNGTIRIDLNGDGMAVGVVQDDSTTSTPGKPVEGATVRVVGGSSITTNAGGMYVFKLAPGSYTIEVSKIGYKTKTIDVVVPANGTVYNNIDMSLSSGVTGIVRSGGSPLQGALVSVIGTSTTTTSGAAGDYSLVLDPGNYTIRFSKSGYITKQYNVTVPNGTSAILDAVLSKLPGGLDRINLVAGVWSTTPVNQVTYTCITQDSQLGYVIYASGPSGVDQMANNGGGWGTEQINAGQYNCITGLNIGGARWVMGARPGGLDVVGPPWVISPSTINTNTYTSLVADNALTYAIYGARAGGGLDCMWNSGGGWGTSAVDNSTYVAICSGAIGTEREVFGATATGLKRIWLGSSAWEAEYVNSVSYTALTPDAVTANTIYGARPGGLDMIYKTPEGTWVTTELNTKHYVALTPDPVVQNCIYGALANGGVDRIANESGWQTTSVSSGSYSDLTTMYPLSGPYYLPTIYGVRVPQTTTSSSIAGIKNVADNAAVRLSLPKVVTVASGTFVDGSSYIEEEDRSSGIRIIAPDGASLALGDRITVTGFMGTDQNGQRYISVTSIDSQTTPGTPLTPLGVGQKLALSSGPGLLSGNLVRVWGDVTYVAPDGGFIYINDGTGIDDGNAKGIGIRVMLSGLSTQITKTITETQFIAVTGIQALASSDIGTIQAVYPRGDLDISEF